MKKRNEINLIEKKTFNFCSKHKNGLKALLAILAYIFVPQIAMWPFEIFKVNATALPYLARTVYLVLIDVLLASTLLYIYADEIINAFKDIKKNHKQYFNEYFKYWLFALGLMTVTNSIISIFVKGDAANQEIIMEIFNRNPLYIFLSAVIFAPIIEELVYRQSFRKIFKNDWLFIMISSLIFGLAHLGAGENLLHELIFLIPYCIPGFLFAYVFVKSKNIFVPMGLHFIHNGFAMALQFFILIFM